MFLFAYLASFKESSKEILLLSNLYILLLSCFSYYINTIALLWYCWSFCLNYLTIEGDPASSCFERAVIESKSSSNKVWSLAVMLYWESYCFKVWKTDGGGLVKAFKDSVSCSFTLSRVEKCSPLKFMWSLSFLCYSQSSSRWFLRLSKRYWFCDASY